MADTLGFSFKPDLEYMTKAERAAFKTMRKDGRISFFRTGSCKVCKTEVMKGKTYCSEDCMNTNSVEAVAEKLINTKVDLETKDGSRRTGKLTGVSWHSVLIDGVEVRWPKGIYMNGDRNDEIPWGRLSWINSAE